MQSVRFLTSSLLVSAEVKAISLPGQRFKVSSQEQDGASQFSFLTDFIVPLQTQRELSFHDGIQYS